MNLTPFLVRWMRGISSCMLIFAFAAISCPVAFAEAEKIYRTGLEAKKGRLAVSPDGQQLVFTTDRMTHGLRLLDLRSGVTAMIPEGVGRNFGFPAWSPDGKQLAVVSAEVRNNVYSLDGMEIELLEVGSWQRRSIAAGDGVKFSPFFSADGKRVFYFKGAKRESGKTPASRYDLYAVDLASGQETRLTHEEFYQAAKGDETQATVLFHATPNFSKHIKDAQGKESRNALFMYELATGRMSLLAIDQSSSIFDFSNPLRDSLGNLYFVSAKANPGGGNYLWYLVRTNREGKQAEILTELPISMRFSIAKNTGEIYVMDKKGEELIIRRLSAQAAH
ncbi:TolB family protein [Ferribacterium limneticum]|uniref:TolB family protein n=1 Tax=Ferribacterium limneticum TaxID=76259 RepID=UPI001CFA8003|nr:hypothetical protein [Ferribacterium limneticum]UCV26983.1 PD40 domain-containing protein [Ferribacterium limneticum]UCV30900.1 PD40 domain-containing protein [Ferribacterium limneticum]